MIRHLGALLTGLLIGLAVIIVPRLGGEISEAAPAPSGYQLNPDIFACCGYPSTFSGTTAGDLQSLNPLSQKLKAGSRTITYSYVVVPGCSDGNMRQTLSESLADASETLGLTFVPVSVGADVSIRATCGTDASNMGLTGGAIADLYPSWPYKSQVNASTVMSTFYDLSQKTIWSHEIMGHALGTWNEQYQLNGAFSPTPGLVDYMNTGDLSRQVAWPQNDLDRWLRTMYPLFSEPAPPPPTICETQGWDPCSQSWIQPNGWAYRPADAYWLDPKGAPEFGPCNSDGLRWSPAIQRWVVPGQNVGFDPATGIWAVVPQC